MDVNATRFHLLNSKTDWSPLINPQVAKKLRLHPHSADLILKDKLFLFQTPHGDELLSPGKRRGAARDRYGNWFWISEDEREIRFLSPSRPQFQHFWSAADSAIKPEEPHKDFVPAALSSAPPDLKLRGLAVTTHHYLVVGTCDPQGLLVFDLHAGGPPIRMTWPQTVAFHPFDMAPRSDGGVWILDVPPEGETYRYWALDRDFQVEGIDQQPTVLVSPKADDFQDADPQPGEEYEHGTPGRKFPTGITKDLAASLPNAQPVALEALPDDSVLIMVTEGDYSVVYRYRFGQQKGHVTLTELFEIELDGQNQDDETQHHYSLQGHDLAFVQDADATKAQLKGKIYIVDKYGNQVFAFHPTFQEDSFSLELIKKYYPLRRFTGKALVAASKAVLATDQNLFYDLEDRWFPVVSLDKPRYEVEGTLETQAFDGKEPGCVWHRIVMDAIIPNNSIVTLESKAADSKDRLKGETWQTEPALYKRGNGSELPYHTPFTQTESQRDGTGSWEVLLQNARGRFLQLRLTLRGTGRNTPQVRSIRLYYPRFSYLTEYLPEVYQRDERSASFLDRFLANIEGLYTALEGRIAEAQSLFDVRLLDREYLDWLATWLGIGLDPAWDETRRRLFLTHAIELYRQRGTLSGLIRMIRLTLDPCVDETLFQENVTAYLSPTSTSKYNPFNVRIFERYDTRKAPGVTFGDPTQPDIPRLTSTSEAWTPEQGAEPLHQRFRNYLKIRFPKSESRDPILEKFQVDDVNAVLLSPVLPQDETIAPIWKDFMNYEIGFSYAEISADDEADYQNFLKHRYRQIGKLNSAYGRNYNGFSTIPLPHEDDMPEGGLRLFDWIQYVSLVALIKRHAHQFTVLIPIDLESDAQAQIVESIALAKRIVDIEKPSHTNFEVKPYWAFFRVGEARVGMDTLLGGGSRFVALILGLNQLGEAYLGSAHPWDVKDRTVLGRDDLGSPMII